MAKKKRPPVVQYFPELGAINREPHWFVRIIGANGEKMLVSEAYTGDRAKANAKRAAKNLAALMFNPLDPDTSVSEVQVEETHV